jgi:hypothetical protein
MYVCNAITIAMAAAQADDRTQYDLIMAFIQAAPEFLSRRIRNCPQTPRSGTKMYHCDPETNVWRRVSNVEAIDIILAEFFRVIATTPGEARSMRTRQGRYFLLNQVGLDALDESFMDRLDSNCRLFPVDNGVFDSSSRPIAFRAIRPEDEISRTAGWSYDANAGAAERNREDLDAYLSQVFPIPEERAIVLKFFANLLSGCRNAKKFLILAGRPGGSNGKSTFLELMRRFFGNLSSWDGARVMRRPRVQRGRNGHSEELAAIKGKRLLVADNMNRNDSLDEGALCLYAGGMAKAAGRHRGSSNMFSFDWQAGMVIVLLGGECPRYDMADRTLYRRMLVAPMRTKFVAADPSGPNEVRVDRSVTAMFPRLLSALADLFMELYENSDGPFEISSLPASMVEWRQSVMPPPGFVV